MEPFPFRYLASSVMKYADWTSQVPRSWGSLPQGAGIVKSVGSHVQKVKPGDAVITTWASCRSCHYCYDGHPAMCQTWQKLNLGAARSDGSHGFVDQNDEKIYSYLLGQSSLARHQIASFSDLSSGFHADERSLGRRVERGRFSPLMVARHSEHHLQCVKVPSDAPLADLAPYGCGAITGAGTARCLHAFLGPGDR